MTNRPKSQQEPQQPRRHDTATPPVAHIITHSALTALLKRAASSPHGLLVVTMQAGAAARANFPSTATPSAISQLVQASSITVIGFVRRTDAGFTLAVVASRCAECGRWQAECDEDDEEGEDSGLSLALPDPAYTYSGAAIVSELPETNCGCEDGGEEPAESGIKMAQFRRELQPSASLGWTTRDAPHPASFARSWFIHSEESTPCRWLQWATCPVAR